MIGIMFYSYKGGSGRTTATANIAASIAKFGKRVLCIDLDTGAPGLYVVFNVKPPDKGKVIQDYLLSEGAAEKDLRELNSCKIDVLQSFRKDGLDIPNNDRSGLWLIPAKQEEHNFTALPLRSNMPEKRMNKLFEFYRDEMDFIFLDSPSGIQNMSALALSVASIVLVFFTWSRQSLTGTAIFSHTLSKSDLTPHLLVASQVPAPRPEWDKSMINNFNKKMNIMKKWFQEEVGVDSIPYSIPDNPMLRINERVIAFDNLDQETEYDRIAKDLIASLDSKESLQ